MNVKPRAIQALRSDKAFRIAADQKETAEGERIRASLHNVVHDALLAFEGVRWTETNITLLLYHLRSLLNELEENHVFARADVRVWRETFTLHVSFRVQASWRTVTWHCVNCSVAIRET